jgi:hypothetical protein
VTFPKQRLVGVTLVVLCVSGSLGAQFRRLSRASDEATALGSVRGLNAAEGDSKPLFTTFLANMVCWDAPFVALASVRPQELVLIRITENGIQPANHVSVPYNDIYGIRCYYDRIELLVRSSESDHFSRLPFKITPTEIQRQDPQEIQYSISQNGPTPPELADFYKIAQQIKLTSGDWRVRLNTLDSKHVYELHFTRTKFSKGGVHKFSVTLLEETFRGNVLKSMPLVHEEKMEFAD